MMAKSRSVNSYISLFLFVFAALIWRTPYYIISLYVAIPLIIIYCFYNYGKVIVNSRYFNPYLFIIVWMFLSSVVNPNIILSIGEMVPILASFLFSMATYGIACCNKHSRFLFLSYVALFIFLMAQNMLSGDFTMNFEYANDAERRSNTKLNANEYAYYSLFAIMSWRLFYLYCKKNLKSIYSICFYLLSLAVVFFVALMTASRQVMALEIPLLAYFFYLDFIRGGRHKFMILLFLLIMIVAIPFISDLYGSSYLAMRSEVGFQDDVRSDLLWRAVEQGINNPLFGLGLGADTFFSHTTYTHILARTGFPAFIVFVYMMSSCILVQWRRYLRTKGVNYLFYLGCLGIIAVGHFTYSYFNEPFMMAIIFAIIGCSDNDYKIFRSKI